MQHYIILYTKVGKIWGMGERKGVGIAVSTLKVNYRHKVC